MTYSSVGHFFEKYRWEAQLVFSGFVEVPEAIVDGRPTAWLYSDRIVFVTVDTGAAGQYSLDLDIDSIDAAYSLPLYENPVPRLSDLSFSVSALTGLIDAIEIRNNRQDLFYGAKVEIRCINAYPSGSGVTRRPFEGLVVDVQKESERVTFVCQSGRTLDAELGQGKSAPPIIFGLCDDDDCLVPVAEVTSGSGAGGLVAQFPIANQSLEGLSLVYRTKEMDKSIIPSSSVVAESGIASVYYADGIPLLDGEVIGPDQYGEYLRWVDYRRQLMPDDDKPCVVGIGSERILIGQSWDSTLYMQGGQPALRTAFQELSPGTPQSAATAYDYSIAALRGHLDSAKAPHGPPEVYRVGDDRGTIGIPISALATLSFTQYPKTLEEWSGSEWVTYAGYMDDKTSVTTDGPFHRSGSFGFGSSLGFVGIQPPAITGDPSMTARYKMSPRWVASDGTGRVYGGVARAQSKLYFPAFGNGRVKPGAKVTVFVRWASYFKTDGGIDTPFNGLGNPSRLAKMYLCVGSKIVASVQHPGVNLINSQPIHDGPLYFWLPDLKDLELTLEGLADGELSIYVELLSLTTGTSTPVVTQDCIHIKGVLIEGTAVVEMSQESTFYRARTWRRPDSVLTEICSLHGISASFGASSEYAVDGYSESEPTTLSALIRSVCVSNGLYVRQRGPLTLFSRVSGDVVTHSMSESDILAPDGKILFDVSTSAKDALFDSVEISYSYNEALGKWRTVAICSDSARDLRASDVSATILDKLRPRLQLARRILGYPKALRIEARFCRTTAALDALLAEICIYAGRSPKVIDIGCSIDFGTQVAVGDRVSLVAISWATTSVRSAVWVIVGHRINPSTMDAQIKVMEVQL